MQQTRWGRLSGRSMLRFSPDEEAPRTPSQRSWGTSASVNFSFLLSRFDARLPGEPSLDQQSSLTASQEDAGAANDDEEEEEEGEEESTDSEPEPEPLMEEEFDGILVEDAIAEVLNKLGRSAPGTDFVYHDLSLSNHSLSDINILCRYVHLEKLDLSYNKINDLSCVSYMPYLLELDASHNQLTTYFAFTPPKNLQVVNFSHNMISGMTDLSAYQSLRRLILDSNNIEKICGLEQCCSLTFLSLADNKITEISGLKNLPIKTLCLNSNQIEKAVGLEDLKALQKLDLSGNQIKSLEGLEEHDLLEEINLENNQVAELGELEYIEALPLLRVLNLKGNPVQEHKDYWLLVIFMLLRLTELDHKKITVQEKVAAVNKFDPPPEVVAAQNHMTHIMYSMMQPQRIFDSTLPSLDAPYPMLVLTGPLACGKRELCHRLCRKFNNYFRYSPCHTTRTAYFGEENRLDYYFVSQEDFDRMVTTGKFIASFKYNDFHYGLGRDTIESIAREGLATCVHLEMEGVRSLKNSYFEPRYILLIPMNKEKYQGQLRRMGLFSRAEIDDAVHRVDMYIKVNLDFPGFFDAVINVDDRDEAFAKLSLLMEEFLGLKQPSESEVTVPSVDSAHLSVPSKASSVPKAPTIKGTDGVAPSPTPNEFLDSSAKNYSAVISARLSAQKTPVEEASLQRRQRIAEQGLQGKFLSSYSQLFQRDFSIAAVTRPRFLEPPPSSTSGPPRSSLYPEGVFLSSSPDQRSRASQGSTRLSLFMSDQLSPKGSRSPVPTAVKPSAEEINVEGEKPEPAPERKKKTPKPKSPSPQTPKVVVRPGSNTKPVLPPIPTGQKKSKLMVAEHHVPSAAPNPKP